MRLKPGQHSHRCQSCKTIWAHGEEVFNNDAAHACPQCGESEFWIYRNYGERRPRRVSQEDRARMKALELLAEFLETLRRLR